MNVFDADDHHHMVRALELARHGLYSTPPNPAVGCVLVRWGQVVGEGFHQRAGEPHAEIVALQEASIAARGATDQHSQLQLYAEGPDDKVYLMVSAAERGKEIKIPGGPLAASQAEFAYLSGHGMGELLDAELVGTTSSLVRRGRPQGRLTLSRVSAEAVGELLMLLEAATALAGPLYGVDPFDQPGVEEAKRLAFAALGRPGYETLALEMSKAPGPEPKYVL